VPEIDENRPIRTADISVFTSKDVREAVVVNEVVRWDVLSRL
jgi:hypothetical protein